MLDFCLSHCQYCLLSTLLPTLRAKEQPEPDSLYVYTDLVSKTDSDFNSKYFYFSTEMFKSCLFQGCSIFRFSRESGFHFFSLRECGSACRLAFTHANAFTDSLWLGCVWPPASTWTKCVVIIFIPVLIWLLSLKSVRKNKRFSFQFWFNSPPTVRKIS